MTISKLTGTQLVGRDGEGIGAIDRVFNKDSTDEPAWVTVRMGVMRREHIMPLEGSQVEEDSIRVPYTQEMVKNSPKLEIEHVLTGQDISVLARYYGTTTPIADTPTSGGVAMPGGAGVAGAAAAGASGAGGRAMSDDSATSRSAAGERAAGGERAASGPSADARAAAGGAGTADSGAGRAGSRDADLRASGTRGGSDSHDVKVPQDLHRDATMEAIRYGERLQVAKESREAGRIKLRTYVEQVATEQRVELHHETFEVERVPVADAKQLTRDQPDWAEQEQEVVLFAERAHVSKEVVPLERIVVRKKVVSEEKIVRDTLRTQQFELIEPDGRGAAADQRAQAGTAGRSGTRDATNRGGDIDLP